MIGDIIEIERAKRSLPDVTSAPADAAPPASVRPSNGAAFVKTLLAATRWISGSSRRSPDQTARTDDVCS
jgi:hypothetical protein